MAHIIVDVSGIGLLSSENLPAQAGGTRNPFKDAVEFLDKTSGRFWHEYYVFESKIPGANAKVYRGAAGRNFITQWIARESGVVPTNPDLYISPEFRPSFLPIESIVGGFQLFAALGLYFEVVDYPLFVSIPDADYQDAVPTFLPGSTQVIDEVEVPVTWEDWHLPNSTHRAIDGVNHIPLRAMTGQNLAGSIFSQLVTSGYTVDHFANYPSLPEVPE